VRVGERGEAVRRREVVGWVVREGECGKGRVGVERE
jgi:hypothetical protein